MTDAARHLSRRSFLFSGAVSAAASSLAAPALALSLPVVGLTCTHTGRSCSIPYDGSLSHREVQAFRTVTQDWRAHKLAEMDLDLFDILSGIIREAGSDRGFALISGYRTPATNRALTGTAKSSLHMRGMALDIRRSDLSTRELRDIARSLRAGGVGYYPQAHNRFVHVDTGPVRYW